MWPPVQISPVLYLIFSSCIEKSSENQKLYLIFSCRTGVLYKMIKIQILMKATKAEYQQFELIMPIEAGKYNTDAKMSSFSPSKWLFFFNSNFSFLPFHTIRPFSIINCSLSFRSKQSLLSTSINLKSDGHSMLINTQ